MFSQQRSFSTGAFLRRDSFPRREIRNAFDAHEIHTIENASLAFLFSFADFSRLSLFRFPDSYSSRVMKPRRHSSDEADRRAKGGEVPGRR